MKQSWDEIICQLAEIKEREVYKPVKVVKTAFNILYGLNWENGKEEVRKQLIKKIEGWEKFYSHKESRHYMGVDGHRQYLIYAGRRILEALG
jgi:hypothetical protein